MPALGKLMWEDHCKFEASLVYVAGPDQPELPMEALYPPTKIVVAGEMLAEQLVVGAPSEDLGLGWVASIHDGLLTVTCNSSLRRYSPLFWPLRALALTWANHHLDIHIIKKKIQGFNQAQ